MHKYIFIILFLLIIPPLALGSIFPPNCVCEITARVLSVKEEPVKKDEYQKEDLTSVDMEIEIIKVGPMITSGISPAMTCQQYKIGQRIKIYAIKEKDFMNKNTALGPDTILKGNIEYSGDERGPWYNFDKIDVAN